MGLMMKRKVLTTLNKLKRGQEFWSNYSGDNKGILVANNGNLFTKRDGKAMYIVYYPKTHTVSWFDNSGDTKVYVEEEYTVISDLRAGQNFYLPNDKTVYTYLENQMGNEDLYYYRDNLSRLYWTNGDLLEVIPV